MAEARYIGSNSLLLVWSVELRTQGVWDLQFLKLNSEFCWFMQHLVEEDKH